MECTSGYTEKLSDERLVKHWDSISFCSWTEKFEKAWLTDNCKLLSLGTCLRQRIYLFTNPGQYGENYYTRNIICVLPSVIIFKGPSLKLNDVLEHEEM